MDLSQNTPGRILIVEDDFDIRDAIMQVLSDAGYDVVGVGNGHEAIELLHTDAAFRLILLDLMMPVMDGWQFRDAQKREPGAATIPVVVLSADASVQRDTATLDANGFLRKPVQLDTLLDTVARFRAA